jgi:serine protease Do
MTLKEKQIYALALVIAIIISGLAGGLAGWLTAQSVTHNQSFVQKVNTVTSNEPIVNVVEKASPAVVSIIVSKDLPKIDQSNVPDIFRQFFGDNTNNLFPQTTPDQTGGTQKTEIGGGSGFIVSADGLIVTNKHVVADTTADYTVLLNDGSKYTAKVLARDPINDLAVLKIDAKNLPTLTLGDSNGLKAGQSVIAIGNALGEFRNTVSTGVISGLARSITASDGTFNGEQLVGLIQTDASINPGNSGGPLLDINGQIIGINVAIAQNAQNIGFALPVNQIKATVQNVEQNGRLITAWLGVRYVVVTADIAKANKLPHNYGALVIRGTNPTDLAVIPGSPADKAGLKENDVILEIDGKQINDQTSLAMIIAGHKPGDVVTLHILDKGKEKDIKVTLEEMKQ